MDLINIKLPKVLETYSNLELPDPDNVTYYVARTNRIFYIDYTIYRDEENDEYSSLGQLIKEIININIEDMGIPVEKRQHITLLIDSPGGELDIAFALADVIESSKTPVYTVALAKTMSAAFIVFLAGHKRFVYPHSQLLIHQGSASFSGGASEIQEAVGNYKKLLDKIKDYTLKKTNIDSKLFAKNQKRDWYLSSSEATELGIAEKVITDISDIIYYDSPNDWLKDNPDE